MTASQKIARMLVYAVLWATTLIHILWGGTLVASDDPKNVTAIAMLAKAGFSACQEGFLYLIAAAFCIFDLCLVRQWAWSRKVNWLFWLVIWQQLLLFVGGGGAFKAMWQGFYLDGTPAPKLHIIDDQAWYLLIPLIHIAAALSHILERIETKAKPVNK